MSVAPCVATRSPGFRPEVTATEVPSSGTAVTPGLQAGDRVATQGATPINQVR